MKPSKNASYPSSTQVLYGINAVRAALHNKNRHIYALHVAQKSLVEAVDCPTAVKVHLTAAKNLDLPLTHDAVHQGVALVCSPLPVLRIDDVSHMQFPAVIADGVSDPRNIGAMLRSCAAFGVKSFVLQDRHAPSSNSSAGIIAKTASGGVELVQEYRVVNIARTIADMTQAGVLCIGLAGEATQRLDAIDMHNIPIAFVVGAEGSGLRRLVREKCSVLARIPAELSLNAATALSVALYEHKRRLVG